MFQANVFLLTNGTRIQASRKKQHVSEVTLILTKDLCRNVDSKICQSEQMILSDSRIIRDKIIRVYYVKLGLPC